MTHAALTDAELVDRWRTGDQHAATLLHQRYLKRLLNLVGKHLADRFNPRLDADDVVQSVFGSFFNGAREGRFEFEGEDDFWKLLLTIALNKVRNTVRFHQTQKRNPAHESFSTNLDNVEGFLSQNRTLQQMAQDCTEFLGALDDVLDRLEPDEQQIIRYQIEGYTQKEIAVKMGLNDRTIRRMLVRLRLRGAELLDQA